MRGSGSLRFGGKGWGGWGMGFLGRFEWGIEQPGGGGGRGLTERMGKGVLLSPWGIDVYIGIKQQEQATADVYFFPLDRSTLANRVGFQIH